MLSTLPSTSSKTEYIEYNGLLQERGVQDIESRNNKRLIVG
jgi:hypothetical protein